MKEEYIKKETTSFKELVKNEQIFAPCVWDCRTASHRDNPILNDKTAERLALRHLC